MYEEKGQGSQAESLGGAQAARWVSRLCHGLVIVIAAGLMFFAHPQIDDLWRGGLTREFGLWGAMKFEWEAWCGRWLGTGLSFLLSSVSDVRHSYTAVLLAINFGYLLAIGYLIRGVLPGLSRAMALLLSVVLLEIYWTGLLTPGETFYWMTGGLENHLGLAVPMLLFGWLFRMRGERRPFRRAVRLCGVTVLAVAACGFNELYGTMLCGLLIVGTTVAWRERRPQRLDWAAAVAGALIGWLIVYSAPGNARRIATTLHVARNLRWTASLVWHQVTTHGPLWLLDVKLQAATLAFVLHPWIAALRPQWCGWGRVRWRWLVPAVTLGMLLGALTTHAWLTGEYMAPRTLAALYMVFLLGWFLTVFVWTRQPHETGHSALRLRYIAMWSSLVLAAGLVSAPSTRTGLVDLVSRAPRYEAAMQRRYRILDTAVALGLKKVWLPVLPPMPKLYFQMEIVNDPADFRNYHTRRFYDLETVTVR